MFYPQNDDVMHSHMQIDADLDWQDELAASEVGLVWHNNIDVLDSMRDQVASLIMASSRSIILCLKPSRLASAR
jgi:hypothetical protein